VGNVTDFRGLRGLPEHALPFKNLGDALHLRNHVIRALEEASIEEDDLDLRRQLLTFVVAGGGFSGVEVVAELNDFVRGVARNYRKIEQSELRVVLLHSGDRILPEMTDSLALFAQRLLKKRGVEIRLKCREWECVPRPLNTRSGRGPRLRTTSSLRFAVASGKHSTSRDSDRWVRSAIIRQLQRSWG
jgi:NADH dehydrogenase